MDKVLVTGSSGFIGSNLCNWLSENGYIVHGVDVEHPTFDLPNSVETHLHDLTSSPELPDVDAIVHLAAHSQVQPIVEDPEIAVENIEMIQHVLSEAERMDAFVVNASSRDVYGSAIKPEEEDVTPDSPNGYAASKLGSEALANAYKNTTGLSVTSLRLANVYGPRDLNQRVIPIFIALGAAGDELTVYGEGKLLDFVHVEDVCRAICEVIDRSEAVSGEIMNIGSGTGVTLPEVASYISEFINSCPGWTLSANRLGDVSRYVSDISKSSGLLGFDQKIPLSDGLTSTVDWYLDRPELLSEIRSKR